MLNSPKVWEFANKGNGSPSWIWSHVKKTHVSHYKSSDVINYSLGSEISGSMRIFNQPDLHCSYQQVHWKPIGSRRKIITVGPLPRLLIVILHTLALWYGKDEKSAMITWSDSNQNLSHLEIINQTCYYLDKLPCKTSLLCCARLVSGCQLTVKIFYSGFTKL